MKVNSEEINIHTLNATRVEDDGIFAHRWFYIALDGIDNEQIGIDIYYIRDPVTKTVRGFVLLQDFVSVLDKDEYATLKKSHFLIETFMSTHQLPHVIEYIRNKCRYFMLKTKLLRNRRFLDVMDLDIFLRCYRLRDGVTLDIPDELWNDAGDQTYTLVRHTPLAGSNEINSVAAPAQFEAPAQPKVPARSKAPAQRTKQNLQRFKLPKTAGKPKARSRRKRPVQRVQGQSTLSNSSVIDLCEKPDFKDPLKGAKIPLSFGASLSKKSSASSNSPLPPKVTAEEDDDEDAVEEPNVPLPLPKEKEPSEPKPEHRVRKKDLKSMIRDEVRSAVSAEVVEELKRDPSLRKEAKQQLRDRFEEEKKREFEEHDAPGVLRKLRDDLKKQVIAELKKQLEPKVIAELKKQHEPKVKADLRMTLLPKVHTELRRDLKPQVEKWLKDELRLQVYEDQRRQVGDKRSRQVGDKRSRPAKKKVKFTIQGEQQRVASKAPSGPLNDNDLEIVSSVFQSNQ